MTLPDAGRLAEVQALTRDYSRYSRSAGGLSAVFGGAFCLLSYLLGAMLTITPLLTLILFVIPVAWLVLKQVAAGLYQQRHGRVQELSVIPQRRIRILLLVGVVVVIAIVAIGKVIEIQPFGAAPWSLAKALHLTMLIAIPIIAWRYLHTPLDLVVGGFLFCQASLALLGHAYPLWSSGIVFVPAAIAMIVIGLREHQKFHFIDQRLRTLSNGSDSLS